MRKAGHLAPLLLACLAGAATAADGLKVGAYSDYWMGIQARLRFNAAMVEASPLSLSGSLSSLDSRSAPVAAALIGDYYFSAPPAGEAVAPSGFRASTGLMVRQAGVSLSDLAWSSRSTATFGTASRLALPSATLGYSDPSAYSVSTMPYLGIGYSGISEKSGWGFWADVGLVVQSPGNALGFGRVLSGSQSLDDMVRELRLAPMVQMGVNYSF